MKSLFTFCLIFVTISFFAQKEFQGKATYMSKTSFDMANLERPGGGQIPEARKKEIAKRMKSMLEKTFILNFDKSSSLYKEDVKLEAPTTGGDRRGPRFGSISSGGTKYKNTKEKVSLEAIEFFGKKFLVSDKMAQLQWELGVETKQIGNYTCYKATLFKDPNPLDFSNFRRPRNEGDKDKKEIEEKKEIKQILVTAWYTPQVPVSNGPGEYWGLPGLILEINEGTTTILCTEIVINPSEKTTIEAPSKGKKITREKYTQIVTKKMEELRQSFQNRGNGRGGNRGRGRN